MQNQIPENWQKEELGKILELLIDHRGITPKKLNGDWSSTGVPALSAKNIKSGQITSEKDIRYVNENMYNRWMPEKLEANDILLTSEAPLGELYFLKDKQDYVLSQRLFGLRANNSIVDPKYLYYFLSGSIGQEELNRRISGTAAEGIRQAELVQIFINFPKDVKEQERIGEFISAFDDKIEVNNKIAKTLEEMAQSIFKEWFIKYNLGDKDGTISKIATIKSGKRPEKLSQLAIDDFTIPVYGAKEIMGYTNKSLFNKKIIFTGRVGTIGDVRIVNNQSWPSDNVLVIISKSDVYFHYLYFVLKRLNFQSFNRGSSQPLVTQSDISNYPINVPEETIAENFEGIVLNMFGLIEEGELENQKLAKMRDLLLPKLMKGEIRVWE